MPVAAAPWWYAGRAADRIVFVDAGSVERDKDIVTYSSKTVSRKQGDPVAMELSYMRADCAKRRLGWGGVQRIGYDEAVIDTSTVAVPAMVDVPAESLADSELTFACSDVQAREAAGAFILAVDDAAFTEALLTEPDKDLSPRALNDRLAADPAVPVIRSTAPPPSSFGTVQTVRLGQPLVPPRDYEKGAQIPDANAYQSDEAGRIYDVAYQGVKNGEIEFEVRGYSIDDLAHPASGSIQTAYLAQKSVTILDLAITIRKVLPDRITYSVKIEKRAPQEPPCPHDGCGEPTIVTAADRNP
uniref:hypothetical protein n=1 Tax=uncultured Sphingomonas sp. TaxID=158754 RepID=UPI0035CC3D8F